MTVVLRTRIPIKKVIAEESGLLICGFEVSDGDEDLGYLGGVLKMGEV